MTATATHLCLVSDQPVPSLTPLIDPRLAVRAAVLACGPERADHARWLGAALALHGIGSEIVRLADAYDLPGLRREFAALAARCGGGVVANITGGSKMMTIAAWEAFSRPQDRLYYVDIRHDGMRWLRPDAGLEPVADRVRLEPYVVAHGLRIRADSPPRRDMPAAAELARLHKRARLFAALKQPSRTGEEGGAWLEELVFAEAQALSTEDRKIQDVARRFVVADGGAHDARIENEIDVAVLRDNTLHLIECKTGQAGKGGPAIAALFKLGQLRAAIGGLRGRGIFVTTEQVSGPLRERGRQLGIAVIDRPQLGKLRAALRAALAG